MKRIVTALLEGKRRYRLLACPPPLWSSPNYSSSSLSSCFSARSVEEAVSVLWRSELSEVPGMLQEDSDSKFTLRDELDSEEVPGIDWLEEVVWLAEVSDEGAEDSGVGNSLDPVLGLEVENSLESSRTGRGGAIFEGIDGRKMNLLMAE